MNRVHLHLCLALLCALAFAACGGAQVPSLVEGDPWEYNLTLQDLPQNFKQDYLDLESGVITNRDVSLVSGGDEKFVALNAAGRRFGHFVEFSGGPPESFNRVAALVVLYRSVEGAKTGHAEGLPAFDPDIEWIPSPTDETVGAESEVFEMIVPGEEAIYRVDFRYLNARVSVGVSGKPQYVPDATPALEFAKLILGRMQAAPVPRSLIALQKERLPDIRGLMITQEDLIELDPINGIVWFYDDNPLPQWTPEKENVVAGYQLTFYRPTDRTDLKTLQPYQITASLLACSTVADARGVIAGAIGPTGAVEIPLEAVGEESIGWYRSGQVTFFSESQPQATYEVNFRVGRYVAGLRVLAFEQPGANPLSANPALEFLRKFATRQAERLKAASQ